ncbi:MAG: methylenetetrahydrofolate--tRNA-(uracil(54)-C(5))-methyltransferase (FADH(2)-oxidizing) TrmFO [Clostridia bacterium]|jgi:methylenetetrahydrofolate--tRNA-(uracil-5-)-methyltransferase|nr:methylenetetrahydrofolate--tRNA-(uracil(54)-C(5))-methyltransferase (FADH(2)-oxidizing) TrmFO [Clostridia bacterium]
MLNTVTIIGAGLAGSEAAWQAAEMGHEVKLFEMRPGKHSPAHHTHLFAELVCSNSLRANGLENAVGLLKEEMRRLNSLIISCADENKVPAGGALAVDRLKFAQAVTEKIKNHPNIEVIYKEVTDLHFPKPVILASGPLTSGLLAGKIGKTTGQEYLYFYDAAAPIVTKDSLNFDIIFKASRYGKGGDDYLNCPMNKLEYEAFYHALLAGEQAEIADFEKQIFFEGCMPIEEMARRGEDTLRYGPMKPVGLINPLTGERPYAVVQLRQDNLEGSLFNIVGFQTKLKWPEQERVLRLIPGLEHAEFVRFGVIHRNTYINSPKVLEATLQLKKMPGVFFTGQITGVEGYVESAASGIVAAKNSSNFIKGRELIVFPKDTAIGGLCHYINTAPTKKFQPMNINFGLLPPLTTKIKDKRLKNLLIGERALESLNEFLTNY